MLTGKSTISMAMFNSYVKLPEGTQCFKQWFAEFRDLVQLAVPWSPQDKAMVYPSKPAKLPAVVASPLVQGCATWICWLEVIFYIRSRALHRGFMC